MTDKMMETIRKAFEMVEQGLVKRVDGEDWLVYKVPGHTRIDIKDKLQ